MTDPEKSDRYFLLLFSTPIFLLLTYLFWVAYHLRLDYFDAYFSLLNARSIASLNGEGYNMLRPYVFTLLLTPIFILEKFIPAHNFSLIASHFFSVTVFSCFLIIFYKLCEKISGKKTALLAVFLISLNPLLIHYAPFSKEDILGAFFTTAAFYFYLKGSNEAKITNDIKAGLCILGAMATRYHLIIVLPCTLGIYELSRFYSELKFSKLLETPERTEQWFRKMVCLFLIPILLFFITPAVLYASLKLSSFPEGIMKFIHELLLQFKWNIAFQDPNQNYRFIVKSCTWPVIIFALIGVVSDIIKKLRSHALLILWLAVFIYFHGYILTVKEARYLFPLFPPLYYFASFGLVRIVESIQSRFSNYLIRFSLIIAVFALCVYLPVQLGIRECFKFNDPVYTSDFAQKLSHFVKLRSHGSNIYWVGPFYPLHPKEFIFDPDDENTYVYHLFAHVISFYSGEQVTAVARGHISNILSDDRIEIDPAFKRRFNDGDVLIINQELENYETKTMPKDIKPLLIKQINQNRLA